MIVLGFVAAMYLLWAAFPAHSNLVVNISQPVDRGDFLIADPGLSDSTFRKTVVLIWEHGHTGTHGVIINRPTKAKLSNVLPMVKAFKSLQVPAYIGGPVNPALPILLFRYESQPPVGQHVLSDVYITTDFSLLSESADTSLLDHGFRVYSGYAGWAPGQLTYELAQGAWRVRKGEVSYIFSKHARTVWEELLNVSEAIQVVHPRGTMLLE